MTRLAGICLALVSVVSTASAEDTIVTTDHDDAPAIVTIDVLTPNVVRGQCGDACSDCGCTDGSCGCDGGCAEYGCGHKNRGFFSRNYPYYPASMRCHKCHTYTMRNGHCTQCGAKKRGLIKKFLAKFGYFCPTGNCGQGMPLWAKYNIVYAAQPGYTDARDGYTYAAPGYGTPVNVPLAPNVRHTYNYGWGVPSSRLTPIRQAQVVGPPESALSHHTPVWRP